MAPWAWHFRLAAGLLAAGLLSGCVVGPDYVRPPIDTPDQFRFDDPQARDLANTRWWEQFEDPVRDDMIRTALADNLDVRIAAARVEEFYSALGITRSGLFPQVGGDVVAGRDRTPSTSASDRFQVDVFAAWKLDVFGRLSRLTEAARSDLLASEEGRRFAVLSLTSAAMAHEPRVSLTTDPRPYP